MKPLPPTPTVEAYDRVVTARSLVVSYLLVAAIPLALLVLSDPAFAVAAGTVAAAGVAGRRVLRYRRDSARQRYFCVPHTPVCVEL